ncbi:hypothetical protein M071_2759, partial [Bacteroides fragilis str. Ds-233]
MIYFFFPKIQAKTNFINNVFQRLIIADTPCKGTIFIHFI